MTTIFVIHVFPRITKYWKIGIFGLKLPKNFWKSKILQNLKHKFCFYSKMPLSCKKWVNWRRVLSSKFKFSDSQNPQTSYTFHEKKTAANFDMSYFGTRIYIFQLLGSQQNLWENDPSSVIGEGGRDSFCTPDWGRGGMRLFGWAHGGLEPFWSLEMEGRGREFFHW